MRMSIRSSKRYREEKATHIAVFEDSCDSIKLSESLASNILAGSITSELGEFSIDLEPVIVLATHSDDQLVSIGELIPAGRKGSFGTLGSSLWGRSSLCLLGWCLLVVLA